jgi:hypothetical protein
MLMIPFFFRIYQLALPNFIISILKFCDQLFYSLFSCHTVPLEKSFHIFVHFFIILNIFIPIITNLLFCIFRMTHNFKINLQTLFFKRLHSNLSEIGWEWDICPQDIHSLSCLFSHTLLLRQISNEILFLFVNEVQLLFSSIQDITQLNPLLITCPNFERPNFLTFFTKFPYFFAKDGSNLFSLICIFRMYLNIFRFNNQKALEYWFTLSLRERKKCSPWRKLYTWWFFWNTFIPFWECSFFPERFQIRFISLRKSIFSRLFNLEKSNI